MGEINFTRLQFFLKFPALGSIFYFILSMAVRLPLSIQYWTCFVCQSCSKKHFFHSYWTLINNLLSVNLWFLCFAIVNPVKKKIKLMSIHIIRTKRRKQKKGDEANQGKNGHNLIKWELFYEREQVFFPLQQWFWVFSCWMYLMLLFNKYSY